MVALLWEKIEAVLAKERHEKTAQERRADYGEIATALTTDYLLAKKLYDQFVLLEEDSAVLDTIRMDDGQREGVKAEIQKIRQKDRSFVFSGTRTMSTTSGPSRCTRQTTGNWAM